MAHGLISIVRAKRESVIKALCQVVVGHGGDDIGVLTLVHQRDFPVIRDGRTVFDRFGKLTLQDFLVETFLVDPRTKVEDRLETVMVVMYSICKHRGELRIAFLPISIAFLDSSTGHTSHNLHIRERNVHQIGQEGHNDSTGRKEKGGRIVPVENGMQGFC